MRCVPHVLRRGHRAPARSISAGGGSRDIGAPVGLQSACKIYPKQAETAIAQAKKSPLTAKDNLRSCSAN